MRKTALLLLLQFPAFAAIAQLSETFSDGDYTANPVWTTSSANDWTVNNDRQLQSNHETVNSSFFISSANKLATAAQWEFRVRLAFNTSSANYVEVYLTASAGNLEAGNTTGYFVRIGNTQDEISLYRKDASGSTVRLIDGLDGVTNRSDNVLTIKVIRNADGRFTLFRDAGSSGNNYVIEGAVTDTTYTTSAFFGFLVRQSTASFFRKHFFDDIEIKAYEPDLTPPAILSVTTVSPTTADVLFSEPVERASAQEVSHYETTNGMGRPASAIRDATHAALVHLTFATAFTNGSNYTLSVNGVKDLADNVLRNGIATFSFYTPQAYDVIIDEIMADPAPTVSLPNAEFIELKNVSGRPVNLRGWRLATTTAMSAMFPDMILPADSFVVLTSLTAAPLFSSYGKVFAINSFPAIPNDTGLLQLLSAEGKTIHAVSYSNDWYQDATKADGGWTLEMIDTNNPCTGSSNWKASTDPGGGTPGRKNSADAVNNDTEPPQLLHAYCTDSLTLVAVFNEPLDSVSASIFSHYSPSNSISIISAIAQPPLFNSVVLQLSVPLQRKTVYTLSVVDVTDCKGNVISGFNKARAGWAEEPAGGDVVINEILFNPRPNAYDYVELYNRSNNVLNVADLVLANRNSSGAVVSQKKLCEEPFLFFPGDYLVATQDKASLQQAYLVKNPEAVLPLSSLPSFPDDKGTVVLLNTGDELIDEVRYDKAWHFALVSDPEGISLERVDPDGPSQDKNNWHSAAATAGYGTPTYRNSQYKTTGDVKATIEISPPVFSPDNDGHDDIATISYQVEEKGYVANVLIFDAGGRLVKNLVRNELLSLKGFWKWDGLGERQNKLPVGTYIVFTEIFNLEGRKKSFKNTVVLARRLN